MKFFQKIALVSAIAAAPFAVQADLTPMDDSLMSNITGQAGVTVEISIGGSGISIGEIEYVDEGSVLLQNVTLNNVNGLTQTIDVDAEGNLLMVTSPVAGIALAIGDTTLDTSGQFSAVALKGTEGSTELVNNLNMTVSLGASTTQIMNLAGANSLATQAQTDGFGAEAFTGSVAIRATSSLEITDLDVGLFGYTAEQAATKADLAINGGNADGVGGTQDATEAGTASAMANGSAIQISDVKLYGTGGEGTAVTVDQVMWANGGTVAQGGGLYIQVGAISGTLEIGGIALAQESIGSIKISDMNLDGMTQRIYGHP
ncbi:MAG: hypothetical protein ACI910_001533 [Oleispira sp.]|jgi:hypothetical protein